MKYKVDIRTEKKEKVHRMKRRTNQLKERRKEDKRLG